jgi:transcriptional regulator with XRE-family HTH domain
MKELLGRAEFTELAARLRGVRVSQRRSLNAVASEFGATPQMLRSWELGRVLPNAVYFIAWVRALGFYVDITDAEVRE